MKLVILFGCLLTGAMCATRVANDAKELKKILSEVNPGDTIKLLDKVYLGK